MAFKMRGYSYPGRSPMKQNNLELEGDEKPKEPKANMSAVTVTPEMEKKRKGSGKNLLTGGLTPTLVQLAALKGSMKNLRKIKGNIHKNK